MSLTCVCCVCVCVTKCKYSGILDIEIYFVHCSSCWLSFTRASLLRSIHLSRLTSSLDSCHPCWFVTWAEMNTEWDKNTQTLGYGPPFDLYISICLSLNGTEPRFLFWFYGPMECIFLLFAWFLYAKSQNKKKTSTKSQWWPIYYTVPSPHLIVSLQTFSKAMI